MPRNRRNARRRPFGGNIEQLKISNRETRFAVLESFARMHDGKPVFCGPNWKERQAGKQMYGNTGKVIYDNAAKARAAAAAFRKLGDVPMEPYPCPRSRNGHCHLRTVQKRKERIERWEAEKKGKEK